MEGLVLQVKQLPAALSTDAIETLLKHVGATRIRVLANKTQKSKTALAVFLDNTTRMSALARLNTMRLSDHDIFAKVYDVTDGPELEAARPSPDIASTKPLHNIPPTTGPASAEPAAIFPPLPRDPPPPPTITCAWRHPAPLAPHLGLHFPPSPLLEYKYPKASPDVVLNIANALMALPTFYTQVLHLMNKMNLPPPFEPNAIPGHFASFVANDTRKQKRDMVFVEEQDDDDDADLAARNLSTKRIRVVPPLPPPTPPANPPSPHSTPSSNGAIRRPEPPTLSEPTPPRTNAVVAVPLKLAPPKSRKPEAMANIFEDVAVAATTKVMPRPGVISEAELARTRLSAEELAQHKHMQNYQRFRVGPSYGSVVHSTVHGRATQRPGICRLPVDRARCVGAKSRARGGAGREAAHCVLS
ncbi:hypothetical protein, variant [Aphanomyces invadans]|uniref:RRM domain-containing protein n=1 Tax=Aphanomyces invadans TaxID=157072 RepID=A0A024UQP5_9STRA|nr:hypothetical protein, variant [Aphanomyces invadans]ETW07918.1 hypothetical protein, variant [Aphanomyces invadans]|eukprot:XP_008864011.1 hypothetical protein, variant [Aphanomyces invadans]